MIMKEENIYRDVQDHYSTAAQGYDSKYGRHIAESFGYSEEELKDIPQDANLGLSCGNPHALANLRDVCFTHRWRDKYAELSGYRVRRSLILGVAQVSISSLPRRKSAITARQLA